MAPQIMKFYTLIVTILGWLGTVMLIGQVVQMTEKVHHEVFSFLGTVLYRGSTRNKIMCPYQQLKQNISLQEVAALS